MALRGRRGTFGSIRNMTVTGGTFIDVQGNYQVHNYIQESGLVDLSHAISRGAMYDSAERYPAGKCHPGTREEIIKAILEWINNPSPGSSDVLWLYGPAGAGKSAIMQTIAEILRELYKDRYAGSFFFARDVPGRNQGSFLFSTLAYQIASNVPKMRELVNHAMMADPTLPTKSMDIQLKSLILDPFNRVPCPPAHTPTIIIDGLDECADSKIQRDILSLIANATATCVPLRFIIASRPEFWIRETFDRGPLFHISQRVNLSEEHSAYQDIEKYLRDGFAEIHDRNKDIMANVQKPWPGANVIDRLVQEASGQFVYASTVLKFVGASSDFSDPQFQLRSLLTPGPLRASAFSDLDCLYSTILSFYPRREMLIKVLGGLMVDASLKTIEILGIEATEITLVLRAISSLVEVTTTEDIFNEDEDLSLIFGPLQREEIEIFHLSFKEFLLDKNRSGPFMINPQSVRDCFFVRGQDIIIGSLRGIYGHLGAAPLVYDATWQFIMIHCGYRDQVSASTKNHFVENLHLALEEFNAGRSRKLWEYKSLLRHMGFALEVLANMWTFELNVDDIIWKEMVQKLNNIQDVCIRQIMATSSFSALQHLPYFVNEVNGSGLGKEFRKTFLVQHSHLFRTWFSKENGFLSGWTWTCQKYCILPSVYRFLSSLSHGGIFHKEFRTHFIQSASQSLLSNLETGQSLLWATSNDNITSDFLNNSPLSKSSYSEDALGAQGMRNFINVLCTCDIHKKLQHDSDMLLAMQWLYRQLTWHSHSVLLPENDMGLPHKMRNTIVNLLEALLFSLLSYAHFQETEKLGLLWRTWHDTWQCPASLGLDQHEYHWLLFLFSPSSPLPSCHRQPWEDGFIECRSSSLPTSHSITNIQTLTESDTNLYSHINLEKISTNLIEFYLSFYVACLYSLTDSTHEVQQLVHSKVQVTEGASFDPWFAHACPSTKIVAGLWTLCYLCLENKIIWRPPTGFCSGAMEYVEKHQLDHEGKLQRWLNDLLWGEMWNSFDEDKTGHPA